ncbi:hypothetical protein Ndes2526B_g01785 [Nannochloris sp. 'desiccata']
MQTISRSMLQAPSMRLATPTGASSTTLNAQRRVYLVPGSSQLMGAGKSIKLAGSLSGAHRQVHQAVCSSGVAHPGEEREGSKPILAQSLSIPTTGMAKGLGSSGRGATMERSKLSLRQEQRSTAPKLDDGMGGGGIGKGIFNGGGGGDDGGDDDDYFNEFGDGDGDGDGDGFFRKVFGELYDAKAINAVLQEWYKTMADLPLILRQAAQMGLFSSAALVRFMSMDVRPNVTRFVTRSLPAPVSREVVGRLMADPAFMQKLALEQMITISCSIIYEARVRGDRFWKELDLVALNTLTLAAANAAVVGLVAPTRAAPAPARHEWQNMLAKLPNNVFESTTPLKSYTTNSRVASLFVKSAELCGVGMLAGAAQSLLAQAAVAVRRSSDPTFEPAMPVPSVKQSALGLGASLGIFANVRYQMIAGFDKYLFDHANYLWSYLTLSGFLRTASTYIGDQTRVYLQGLPAPVTAPATPSAAQRQRLETQRRLIQERYMQFRQQTVAASGESGTATAAVKKGKKKRKGSKKSASSGISSGFEMGVGPAVVAA